MNYIQAKAIGLLLSALVFLLASCSGAHHVAPEPTGQKHTQPGCDHCPPRIYVTELGEPAFSPNHTPSRFRINADGSILAYRKKGFNNSEQYFFDLNSNEKWSLRRPVGKLSDSLDLLYIEHFIDWSPYDPTLALVLMVVQTPASIVPQKAYSALVIFNVKTRSVESLVGELLDFRDEPYENDDNTRWMPSSRPGNDTIVVQYRRHSQKRHLQSGTVRVDSGYYSDVIESGIPGRYFQRIDNNTPSRITSTISGLFLDVFGWGKTNVRSATWSPDGRYLSLLLVNYLYDTTGGSRDSNRFSVWWPCSKTELWVFDVDELMRTRDLSTKPLFQTNIQQAHCRWVPVPASIVSTKRGTLLISLWDVTYQQDMTPIYEMSLNGEIIRKVVDNP